MTFLKACIIVVPDDDGGRVALLGDDAAGKKSKQSKMESCKDLIVSSTNLSSKNDGNGDWGSIVLSSEVG